MVNKFTKIGEENCKQRKMPKDLCSRIINKIHAKRHSSKSRQEHISLHFYIKICLFDYCVQAYLSIDRSMNLNIFSL